MDQATLLAELHELERLADQLKLKAQNLRLLIEPPTNTYSPQTPPEPARLRVSTKLSKAQEKKEQGKAYVKEVIEHLNLLARARAYQRKFNLLTSPHRNRVLEYEKTGDPKAFDGIRKKS